MRTSLRRSLTAACVLGAVFAGEGVSAQPNQVDIYIYQIDTQCPSLGYKASGTALSLSGKLMRGTEVYRNRVSAVVRDVLTTNNEALRTFVRGAKIQPLGADTDCPSETRPPATPASGDDGEFEGGSPEFNNKAADKKP